MARGFSGELFERHVLPPVFVQRRDWVVLRVRAVAPWEYVLAREDHERGVSFRAVIVVDKAGVVRFRQRYTPGTLPDAEEIVKVVESLG